MSMGSGGVFGTPMRMPWEVKADRFGFPLNLPQAPAEQATRPVPFGAGLAGTTAGATPVSTRPRRGMFGAPMMSDGPNGYAAAPIEMPEGLTTQLDYSARDNAKPSFFAEGGAGRNILGMLGDTLSQWSGGQATFAPAMAERRRAALAQAAQAAEYARQDQVKADDRAYEASKPQFFSAGKDRIRYDPQTGAATTIYDAPESFQAYADTFGEPGSQEYNTAAQDYVLRGNGPTAFGYDADLEGVRQGNRVSMENLRQGNRTALRTSPTYRDLHPAPRGGGGGRRGPAPGSMAGTMAPLLAKVARGEPLTPGEQQAWSMYRPARGGRGAGGGGGGGGGAGGAVQVHSQADYQRLPAGTAYIAPDGSRRVKGK